MLKPMKLIEILARQTQASAKDCPECHGAGEIRIYDAETGADFAECRACLGSGYNQLGLILQDILQPPAEGFGPVELQDDLVTPQEPNPPTNPSRLSSLADQKYALSRLRQQVDEELARIDEELKEELAEGEMVFSRQGIGYRLCIARQDVYDDAILQDLDHMKLLPYFAKVSTARLKELVKSGVLSWKEFNRLKEKTHQKEIPTLREVVHPDMRIVFPKK